MANITRSINNVVSNQAQSALNRVTGEPKATPLSISTFVSNIASQGGLASPNKYRVAFYSPISGNDEAVSIMCNVANLPSRSIQTVENRHLNTPFKLPYNTLYDIASFSFINTIGLEQRHFFEDWQEKVIDPATGLIGFYNDFVGDIVIEHLAGDTGDVDYSVKLYNAYPTDINDVSLGYSMSNDTLITTVGFSYKYWERI